MKARKILLVLCMAFVGIFAANADNDRMITAEQLPKVSREFIQKYFKDIGVSYVKLDQDFMEKSYEVLLTNGSKVEFDRNGQWIFKPTIYKIMPRSISFSIRRNMARFRYRYASVIRIFAL